ncbi:hypothetical protein BgiMline_007375, partial [Biomphalaria glabrata]
PNRTFIITHNEIQPSVSAVTVINTVNRFFWRPFIISRGPVSLDQKQSMERLLVYS